MQSMIASEQWFNAAPCDPACDPACDRTRHIGPTPEHILMNDELIGKCLDFGYVRKFPVPYAHVVRRRHGSGQYKTLCLASRLCPAPCYFEISVAEMRRRGRRPCKGLDRASTIAPDTGVRGHFNVVKGDPRPWIDDGVGV